MGHAVRGDGGLDHQEEAEIDGIGAREELGDDEGEDNDEVDPSLRLECDFEEVDEAVEMRFGILQQPERELAEQDLNVEAK
jgi:hypothetical protein